MADLVTRLLLNSSNFDNNIKKSSQQVQQFQKTAQNITATIGKFAGALGIAMGANEAFERVIRGSQATSDAYDVVMRSVNNTVDSFFTAISTGDFSVFNMGLSRMIQKAKEAQQAIDKLGNATMSYSYFDSKYSAELEDAINKAKDLRLSQTEREQAKKTAEAIIGKQQEITNELSKSISGALSSVLTEGNALKSATKIDLEDILLLDITATGEVNKQKLQKEYEEYLKIYSEVKKKHTTTTYIPTTFGGITSSSTDTKAVNEEMQQYNTEYRQAILYNEILVKKGDDWLKNTIQMAQQLDNANRKLTEMKNKTLELSNQAINVGVSPVGSIAELEKKIQAKKTELNVAVSKEDRVRINKELEELTEQKRIIEFQYKFPDAPTAMLEAAPLPSLSFPTSTLPTTLPEIPSVPIENIKFTNPIKRSDVKINNDYADSLNAIASVMGSVSSMTEEGAAAWITYGANVISAVAAAIPAISTLFAAKTAEAGASAAASAAQVPVVGWLLAGAAVASVLAAVATLPSFSGGGIFDGNSTVGDMNLARVNAGEMILNNRQQKNLFNLLNGNGTLSKDKTGNVTFKIQGKELVGVLNNYNNQKSKVR